MPKLKFNAKYHDVVQKYYIGNVRPLVLQKLLLLNYAIFYPEDEGGIYNELRERANKKKWGRRSGIVAVLKPADVMKILGCSYRTAIDYKNTLEKIYWLL